MYPSLVIMKLGAYNYNRQLLGFKYSKQELKRSTMDELLDYHTRESQAHALISRDNLKAMQENTKQILIHYCDLVGSVDLQSNTIYKQIEEKTENLKLQVNLNEISSKLHAVGRQIQKKERSIQHLENRLKNENKQFEQVKLDREQQRRTNKATLNGLQKALKHFTKHFQYSIDTETMEDPSKYCVVIKFLNKIESKHPIRFIFDRSSDSLLEFDASAWLSKEEHEALSNCYKGSPDNVALMCALRNIVLDREKL